MDGRSRRQRLGVLALIAATLSPAAWWVQAGTGPLLAAAQAALAQPQLPALRPERAVLTALARAGQRVVAVGEHGVIAWSDDDGLNWLAARSGTDATLTQVAFADERVGWAIGHLGVVLRTDDGGLTWTRQLDGVRAAALAQAQASQGDAAQQDWAARLVEDGPDKPWLQLLVEDAQRLTLVGAFNNALHSEDGGRNWRWISVELPNPKGYHLYGLVKSGEAQWVVGEQGLMLRRGVGKTAFTAQAGPYEGSYFGIVALEALHLVVYGLRGHVFHSTDGGLHWAASQVPSATATFNAAVALGGDRLALCDQAGRVFLSADAGRSFRAVPMGSAPATGIVASRDGGLLLSTLAGVVRIEAAQLASTWKDISAP